MGIKRKRKRRVLTKRILTVMLTRMKMMTRTRMMKMIQSLEREASETESRRKPLKERQVQEAAREEVEWHRMRMNLTMEKRRRERRRNQRFKQRRKRRGRP